MEKNYKEIIEEIRKDIIINSVFLSKQIKELKEKISLDRSSKIIDENSFNDICKLNILNGVTQAFSHVLEIISEKVD